MRHRSAITGQYVTEKFAAKHKNTTVSERTKKTTNDKPKTKK